MTGLNSLGIVKVIVFLFALSGMSVNAGEKNTLVVASLLQPGVENNPGEIMARAERIIQQMSIPGLIDVEIKEYKSITEVIDAFALGDIDWVTSSLFPALIYAEYAGADIFEQRLSSGIPKFYSVFFVRKDSSVNSLADIEKKILSFGNAFSSGAYFAPYYELNEQHYNMINYGTKLDDEVVGSKRRIYFKFAYNEDEIVRNV
ncbi:MAG: phosphate/phosphite/phosphonate ABC transporter substrate-binding protein, partial [Gammaproteobacteria bacterium]|nr:phosphate/phosphite/phosphonate ABC transporter substrate-binding protein [Gammaproteobacteria bacterium]